MGLLAISAHLEVLKLLSIKVKITTKGEIEMTGHTSKLGL
jgi:hypothetical protein